VTHTICDVYLPAIMSGVSFQQRQTDAQQITPQSSS